MSDEFAIAAVTATISYLLESNGIAASTRAPDAQTMEGERLNIFLYQVAPNLGYRNNDQPARNFAGELVRKQQLGLDLYYLLTAYGNSDDELSAQLVLAKALRVLHENPVLMREIIKAAISSPDVKADLTDIETSDLADQVELVKLSMQGLSLEDLTKIWSSFFKTGSYRISVAYKATVVLLDSSTEPKSAMPVAEVKSYVFALSQPEITYIQPQMMSWLSGGAQITIVGKNLAADVVKINLGDGLDLDDMAEPSSSIAGERMTVEIPDTVKPGTKQVRVLHPLLLGNPATMHTGIESNIALFAIAPVITDVTPSPVARESKLTVKFEPRITPDQKVKVIISTHQPLDVEWTPADSETGEVQVNIPGDYETGIDLPVRIKVDGVESQPDGGKWINEFKRPVVRIS